MRVSVLIPAFDEASRIEGVLRATLDHPMVDEVVVVDDGSRDGTARIVRAQPRVNLLELSKNVGKSRALAHGLPATTGDVIVLIDADLTGLTAGDLTRLIEPVTSGRAQMSISLRGNAPAPWRWIGIDYISGERALARDLLERALPGLDRLPRFGFEVHLNRIALARPGPIAVVPWPGVVSPIKARKRGLWRGIGGDLGMVADILRTVSPVEILAQIIGLRRRRLRPQAARSTTTLPLT